jgi:hypothetical protein
MESLRLAWAIQCDYFKKKPNKTKIITTTTAKTWTNNVKYCMYLVICIVF